MSDSRPCCFYRSKGLSLGGFMKLKVNLGKTAHQSPSPRDALVNPQTEQCQ